MVTFTSFINCCGAGILYGFYEKPTEVFRQLEEKKFQDMFGEKPVISVQHLKNVGFIHATLNEKQLLHNEELLLRYGFKRVSSGINRVHNSKIYHYIRVGIPIKEPKIIKPKKLVKRRFSAVSAANDGTKNDESSTVVATTKAS